MTINGCGFTGTTAVNFGATAATGVVVISDSQITAISPAHAAGAVDITVTTPGGTSATTAADQFTYVSAASQYVAVTSVRLLDTRSTGGPLGPGGSRDLTVAGVTPGAPSGASGVVINVTVTNTTAPSFLTVYPTGGAKPLVSNLNWMAGTTIPNLVTVQVGSGGAITFFNAAGSVDVVVDLEGYFATAGTTQVGVTPARITDTRPGSGVANAGGTLGPAATLNVQVTGAGPLPATGVTSVILNVTVTNTTAPSFLTVWPTGAARPLASNLNWMAGTTIPNRVIVPVGTGGQVSFYNQYGSVDVIVDVGGYFTATGGKSFTPVSPVRIEDTRTDSKTIAAGGTMTLQVAGVGLVPSGATAVIVNVTVTNTTAPSFLTVYPSTASRPLISDLNWMAGVTIPNMVVVTLGTTGAVSFYSPAGSVDVIVDLAGWFS